MRLSKKELDTMLKKNKALSVSDNSEQKYQPRQKRGKAKDEFQSYAERLYWETVIQPLMLVGEIVSFDLHRSFEVVPAVKWGNVSLRAKSYTPDFFLTMKDGSIKVVEIKGKVVRKLQRDYPLRRQLFILNYCIPQGWQFEEVSAESLTGSKAK